MEKFTGGVRSNKPEADELYRPFMELDCKLCREFAASNPTSPLVVADVGSRGGFDPRWDMFGTQCQQIGFEADRSERDRLMDEFTRNGEESRKTVYPSVVWSEATTARFHIPRQKEAASLLEPNMSFYSRLPEPTMNTILITEEVHTTTLDACAWPESGIDFLKIDVEGADLFVLKGAKNLLSDRIMGVVVEVTFVGHYIGQGFFSDIDVFLRELGFGFFDLKPRRWRRKRLTSNFEGLRMGQLVCGDALYLKDPVEKWNSFCRPGLEREKLIKLAVLSEFFSLPDFSIEVLELAQHREFLKKDESKRYIDLLNSNEVVTFNDFTRHAS